MRSAPGPTSRRTRTSATSTGTTGACETQAEVDRLWDKLSAGGKQKPCGWLEDRFGVSWQIIPSALMRLMGDKDPAKAARVTQAMLTMKKIEIAGLQKAYDAAA